MKHYLSILILFLLMLVACDPAAELGTPFHKGQEVVLTAAIGEQRPQMMPGMQRISGKDSETQINLLWDEGDEIRVCVDGASSVFRLIDGAGTANASFKGTMPASGSSFEVSYPVDYNDELLQQQTYVPDGIAKGLMKMSTPSPGTFDDGFTLQAQHAVLGLQLTGNSEIGKIVLTKNGTDGKAAAPSYTLNCTSIVHGKLSNSKSSGVTLSDSPTLFYIVLPTGTWEHGFTVTVYAADNTTIIDSLVTTKPFTFESTNATMMAAKDVQDPPKRIGIFSVAANRHVTFSQGNLQYTQKTNTWQFASEQYKYIGEANMTDGALADRIDLFGWSAQNAQWGVSTNTAQYAGDFVDWGTNTISGDAPNTWRTLSEREWNYLLNYRPRAAIRKAVACVNGVNGLILLPDEWVCPAGIDFVPVLGGNYNINRYYASTWAAMEAAGAVFFPAAGRRYDKVDYIAERGYYWSATQYDNGHSHCLQFLSDKAIMSNSSRYYGRSVRLVHDTILPPPVPEYVDLGLSVKWATFNVGARAPEYYGDYFAWGETEPKEEYSWATYKWCDGTKDNVTKYNKTDSLTTLEPEDDAAHVHWGNKWRMPTKEELQELIDSCQWERTTVNEVRGNTVTGPNGNSIFIPLAGSYNSFDNQLHSIGTTGWLYSSTRSGGTSAVEMNMGHGGATTTSCSKCLGLNIRPVYDNNSEQQLATID